MLTTIAPLQTKSVLANTAIHKIIVPTTLQFI